MLNISNLNNVPLISNPLLRIIKISVIKGFRYSSTHFGFLIPWNIPIGITLFGNSFKLRIEISIGHS